MSKASVFNYGWIDLVFEGRNQNYGAYQLRRQDPRTTVIALLLGIGLIGVLVGIPATINYFSRTGNGPVEIPRPNVIKVDKIYTIPEPEKPKPQEQAAGAAAPKSPEETKRFTPPTPVSGPADDEVPTTREVQQTNPGQMTQAGTGANEIVTGPTSGTGGTGGTGTPTAGTGNEVVSMPELDVMPEFPGGIKKFFDYVGKNFRTPDSETAGTLKVYVSFIIEKDGTLTDIKVPHDPGSGMGDEAIRVLKSLKTKWKPGIRNGMPVRTKYYMPIIVRLH
ncbi:hypothetical protein CHU92_14895 [Flavobacterium cyanobacteriorum]|uniref:TonB C-terminal domain-containing protein n=1 Tax=Flavobacterium cyanobacteriorum TaxID=2022802 RepID=A0A255YRS9_9FLAO|nr:energy transducer TonB [Flavobacterium cyanobacteriorum]OYQ31928.1 hypothetical protein CHU92_14895 [Flavobacterium cyanobacteriorum]